MNFKQAIGKTIESIEVLDSERRVVLFDDSPLPEIVRQSSEKLVRFKFTDGTDDEISLRCD